MKERPILMTGENVRGILVGHKTMTRRVINFKRIRFCRVTSVKPHPGGGWMATDGIPEELMPVSETGFKCLYGIPGDRLWVRETFSFIGDISPTVHYKADNTVPFGGKWKPSIYMPPVAKNKFRKLWDSINGKKYPWASDPVVWVIEFKRIAP